jgi:DNA invertase Pin-like site-specific DNA recombinase
MNKSTKRLLDRARNNLRALLHTRLDRTQRRLFVDVKETLNLLEEVENENDSAVESQQRGVN